MHILPEQEAEETQFLAMMRTCSLALAIDSLAPSWCQLWKLHSSNLTWCEAFMCIRQFRLLLKWHLVYKGKGQQSQSSWKERQEQKKAALVRLEIANVDCCTDAGTQSQEALQNSCANMSMRVTLFVHGQCLYNRGCCLFILSGIKAVWPQKSPVVPMCTFVPNCTMCFCRGNQGMSHAILANHLHTCYRSLLKRKIAEICGKQRSVQPHNRIAGEQAHSNELPILERYPSSGCKPQYKVAKDMG